ncbi:hypothetical protein D3C85_1612200 [compost metagenome]
MLREAAHPNLGSSRGSGCGWKVHERPDKGLRQGGARIEARELTENEARQFMLNQAVGFLQANNEAARTRDSAELIQIAVEGGSRLLLSKPE